MTKRLEIPGAPAIEFGTPSPGEQEIMRRLEAIHAQQQQLIIGLNTLLGQVDVALRLASGFYSKHQVKVKFEDHDAKVRAMEAVAQQSNSNEETASDEG